MKRSKEARKFEVTLRISANTWMGVVHAMGFFAEHWRGHIGDRTCNANGDRDGTAWSVSVKRRP